MKIIKSLPAANIYYQEAELTPGDINAKRERGVINVYPEIRYQQIMGIGGAFTESAAYNYSLLSDDQKKDFMEKYFGRTNGLGYNFGRCHINSCDFSLDIYDYVQCGDKDLSTFNMDRERKYVIPFIKDAQKYTGEDLMLFASPWSPPAYMKENESAVEGGTLKEAYMSVWANYYCKFIKEMEKEGITISAISVQNEPNAVQPWESCQYTAEQERDFIEHYLAPALDRADLSHIKIIIWDHNKERAYERARDIFSSAAVQERVWAVGHHWYSGDHFESLRLIHEQFNKVLISSEICGLIYEDPITLAEKYAKEICEDFNNFTSYFCDWNLLLDDEGGPFHNRTRKPKPGQKIFEDKSKGCHAPVLYNTQTGELTYTPIYYYIGHFSKYIQKGAYRIATTKHDYRLHVSGFQNPDGSILLIIMNPTDESIPANIRHNNICTGTDLSPHSIMTIIL